MPPIPSISISQTPPSLGNRPLPKPSRQQNAQRLVTPPPTPPSIINIQSVPTNNDRSSLNVSPTTIMPGVRLTTTTSPPTNMPGFYIESTQAQGTQAQGTQANTLGIIFILYKYNTLYLQFNYILNR